MSEFLKHPRRIETGELYSFRPITGYPEPAPKHDGNLDKDGGATVEIDGYLRVVISNQYLEAVCLTSQQSLSLHAWLTQELSTLEQLAKEQGA